jgi:hypothetical protein
MRVASSDVSCCLLTFAQVMLVLTTSSILDLASLLRVLVALLSVAVAATTCSAGASAAVDRDK